MNDHQPLVCDLTAIPADARQQHLASIPELFGAVQAVQELPDGYAFRFDNEPGRFLALANFVEHEQLCCSFEGFAIEIEPHAGPIWLRLTGGEGVKEMLAAEVVHSPIKITDVP
jgi:hypothetical protein